MNKIVKIVLAVLGLISAILWYQLPGQDMPASEAVESGAITGMFTITYILLAIAVVASLLFTLVNLFAHPQKLKKTLIVIGAFLIVLGFAYAISSGTDVNLDEMASRGIPTTEATVKNIGTGLNLFFLLVIIAVVSMLWGGVKKMTNK
jgi:4-hydroxybenzoate polyprenyltransferase